MSIYACRKCGSTDNFVIVEVAPTRRSYIARIEGRDGAPFAVLSGEFIELGGSTSPLYACNGCGIDGHNLDKLVEKVA